MTVLSQLAAVDASVEALKAQLQALRASLDPPKAIPTVVLEARCEGVDPERCGLQNDEAWIERGTFMAPHAKRCVGCRVTV